MVNLKTGIKKLPPEEKLKLARKLETEKRLILEEELTKKEAEIEKLKQETIEAIEEAKKLEEESLEELTSSELEERVEAFKKEKGFLPAKSKSKEGKEGGVSGFGQVNLYESDVFKEAEKNLDYLINAKNPSRKAIAERSRSLYQNIRELASRFDPSESYAFNKMQEQLYELKQQGRVENIYTARTNRLLNEMTDIIDYRKEDEEQRRKMA